MLLHVVLAGKGLVALWAEGVLLARVLFRVASGMARGGEMVLAVVLLGERARVGILLCLLFCRTLRRGRGLVTDGWRSLNRSLTQCRLGCDGLRSWIGEVRWDLRVWGLRRVS